MVIPLLANQDLTPMLSKSMSITNFCPTFPTPLQATERNFAKVYRSVHIEKILFRVACSFVRESVHKLVTDVN